MSEEPEDVKKEWPERLKRLLRMKERIDPTGMTPVKRAFLEKTGQPGPFVESAEKPVEKKSEQDDKGK